MREIENRRVNEMLEGSEVSIYEKSRNGMMMMMMVK